MKCEYNPDDDVKSVLLNLENTKKMANGLELLLENISKTGERGFTIQIIQGFLGEFLTAREYLLKGHTVFRTHSKYDLSVEGVGRVEVKTAKCWNHDQTGTIGKGYEENFFANAYKLEMDSSDVLSLVLLNGSTPFKILCIKKAELSECTDPHTFVDDKGQHPYIQYHSKEDLLESEKRKPPYEIYEIERKLVLDEKSYLLWVNPKPMSW